MELTSQEAKAFDGTAALSGRGEVTRYVGELNGRFGSIDEMYRTSWVIHNFAATSLHELVGGRRRRRRRGHRRWTFHRHGWPLFVVAGGTAVAGEQVARQTKTTKISFGGKSMQGFVVIPPLKV